MTINKRDQQDFLIDIIKKDALSQILTKQLIQASQKAIKKSLNEC